MSEAHLCSLGQPLVHTIFVLLSPTIRGHLQLLSRLSLGLLDSGFKGAVLRRAGREEIFAEAKRVDAALAASEPKQASENEEML
jgi:PTS system nitrogen regulatory IIA component